MVAKGQSARTREAAAALATMATPRSVAGSQPIVNKIVRVASGDRAYFDAADHNRYTANHFAAAGAADINTIIRSDINTLRRWCRYEALNNSYGRGIVETLGNDLVGLGPRAQVTIPGVKDPTQSQRIEDAWAAWAEGCDADGRLNFGEMMNLGVKQCPASGESFAVMVNDPAAAKNRRRVSLRLRLIESDRVVTPFDQFGKPNIRDGMKFDDDGRPTHYIVLKRHPGDTTWITQTNPAAYDEVPVDKMIHIYRMDRPGQNRGIPWFATSLLPLAHLRRYTMATVTAAERAASISGIVYTTSPDIDTDAKAAFDEVEIPHDSLLTMPAGYEMKAFEPSQPTSTYAGFKGEMLDEIGRGLCMPHNIVAGNSSGYNYASGRLDWQVYFRMIRTLQAWLSRLCAKVFVAWYAEYLITTNIHSINGNTAWPEVKWYWPGHEHVDPVKEANAQRIRLNSLTTTLEDEYAIKGEDWLRKIYQIAKERGLLDQLGLTLEDAAPSIITANESDNAEDAAEENENGQTKKSEAA